MWCPHDIGRDSWVWGEQGTLEMMNSPHEVGDEALTVWNPVVGRKRGGPRIRLLLLLNINIILRINIVEPDGPRRVAPVLVFVTFQQL